jgi:hypothetical protein
MANFGSLIAAAVARKKANQQQGNIGNALDIAQNNMSSTGMANNNIASVGGILGSTFGSFMQGRNINNQNQLASTNINPNAFNTGMVGRLFNQKYIDPVLAQKKSSPLKQDISNSIDPLTGQYIDPTISQGLDPGTVNPEITQDITSLTQY